MSERLTAKLALIASEEAAAGRTARALGIDDAPPGNLQTLLRSAATKGIFVHPEA